ncbi:hypothetical protein BDF22DRAFT_685403 [Syncephalis plumigaleata]|nr:hypothetical protein BDF22DRAFT_685403 [Syncephalis plumigaleata]
MEANTTTLSPVYNGLNRSKLPSNIAILDFLSQSANISDARIRLSSNSKQLIIANIILYMFVWNTWKAFKLLRSRPVNKSYWCCFIQAFLGVILGMSLPISFLSSSITCRILGWMLITGLATSSICTIICLLLKAYVVQMRDKRVLWFGIVCIPLPTIALWGVVFNEDMYFTSDGICMTDVPQWIPIVRGCIEIFTNSVFSCIFLRAVIKQYQAFGSNCWSKLKSDGLLYLLGAAISSIVCALISVFQSFGPISEIIFFVDWIAISTLLVHQYQNMRTVLKDNRPQTQQFTYWQEQ